MAIRRAVLAADLPVLTGFFQPAIDRNTPTPASREREFSTP